MLARDEDILKAAEDWRKAGRGVALATVVETWGSAPRPVGSNLVIDDEGNFLGSVSGGCVEGAVVTEAHRRDRERQAEDAGIRRRRRDRLEGRPVLRRHDPGLRREGGVDLAPRYSQSAERRTRRAARRHRRHRSGERRAAAREGRRRRAAIRCKDVLEKHLRIGQERHGGDAGRQGLPHRARAAAAAGRHRRGAYQPGAGADGGSCSATTSPSSIRARPSPRRSAFPT